MASGFFSFLLLIFLSISLSTATDATTEAPKKDKDQSDALGNSTASLTTVICLILNLATVAILYMALREARRTPELLGKYRLSMHWLSRTAIRHSIGPNAKKILVEYVEKEEKEKKEKKK